MTLPASALSKMRRVLETFRAKRNRVVIKTIVGYDARLKALLLKDARDGLNSCLHGEGIDDYSPLHLHKLNTDEWGISRLDMEDVETHRRNPLVESDTRTAPLGVDRLMAPDTHYVIRAPSGAGKTTLTAPTGPPIPILRGPCLLMIEKSSG